MSFHYQCLRLCCGGRVLEPIRETGELSDETEAELRKAVESFRESFQGTNDEASDPAIGTGPRAAGDSPRAEAAEDTGADADADAGDAEPTAAG